VRLYSIEEVENRPYIVRVILYVSSVTESEARYYVKNLNSLRNYIMCENRPQQIVASLKMLKKPKNETEKYFAQLASGLAADDMEDISEGEDEKTTLLGDQGEASTV